MPAARPARWTLGLLALGASLVSPSRLIAEPTADVPALIRQAEAHARQGEWDKACELYEGVLRLRRDTPEVRDRYQHCLRRHWQARRHADLSFRKEVLSVDYGQALRLFTLVRDTLLDGSLDRKKLDPARLFRKGLEELDHALADPFFCQQHVPFAKLDGVSAFRALVSRTWGDPRTMTRAELAKQVREIALLAQSHLHVNPSVVVMELACGACYATDEYTVYLTPHQLRELCQSLRGEMVGVGLTLGIADGRVLIRGIAEGSPASEAALSVNDEIVSVDRRAVADLPLDLVREALEGSLGSSVEVDVLTQGTGLRSVQLRRRALFLPSVSYYMLPDGATAYLRIACFQDTTLKELDESLGRLAESGMKALVIDLRGNSGGLFDSAIEVARRFLSSGVVASTQHQDPKYNAVYHARNPAAVTVPLVVLIDADTASAAEVLAGALKENGRATLVGQTTFGKGCTQCLLRLPALNGGVPTGGMRLTVARFFSPKGLPYTGRGVLPDVIVDREVMPESMMQMFDAQLGAAVAEAERQLGLR